MQGTVLEHTLQMTCIQSKQEPKLVFQAAKESDTDCGRDAKFLLGLVTHKRSLDPCEEPMLIAKVVFVMS